MSKIKIMLGIGGIILFCVVDAAAILLQRDRDAKRAAQEMQITDPVEIAQIASGIANYQLPPNYEEALVVKLKDTYSPLSFCHRRYTRQSELPMHQSGSISGGAISPPTAGRQQLDFYHSALFRPIELLL